MRNALVCTIGLLLANVAAHAADDHTMHHGHAAAHSAAPSAAQATDAPSTRELNEANAVMHKAMDITYTHDADIDFLRGMIAHHRGAVDMARVQLRYGRDARVTRMAQEIIRAQELEIAWMEKWLVQLEALPRKPIVTEPRRGLWSDKAWNGKTWLGER